MGRFSSFIRSIKEKLFGRKQEPPEDTAPPSISENASGIPQEKSEHFVIIPVEPAKATKTRKQVSARSNVSKRTPYFVQIGFDYGTSYSKCVCRDVMTDKAWVHVPRQFSRQELPFLIPSALIFKNGKLKHVEEQNVHYPQAGLYHLKPALVKVALCKFDDPILDPFKRASEMSDADRLREFVISCGVYFLAGSLGAVRDQVRLRMPDFGNNSKDYMAVNLAVPVADAERPAVNRLYNEVLCEAWGLADLLSGHPPIELKELTALRHQNRENDGHAGKDCFIYPEVSANVQGFVRSRVSAEGIYLFSDTGAATVDQSMFIFFRRPDNTDHLTYLHASVLPCGSSQIELNAARLEGRVTPETLEMWRQKKESNSADIKLKVAKNMLAGPLSRGTVATLARTKGKLYVREQINGTRVIFGGGGHCKHPYRTSVMTPFSGNLFRRGGIRPDVAGVPHPADLELDDTRSRWMNRLGVAYGLSFHKTELAGFTYPREVESPESDQIWQRSRKIPAAPDKEHC